MPIRYRRRQPASTKIGLALIVPLALLASLAAPATASAQAATAPVAVPGKAAADDRAGDALATERARLRQELARANAEIDRLKRADRGLRSDYRLRARLADAEAIARRLTEIDALLLRRGQAATARTGPAGAAGPGGPGASAPRLGAEPGASPTDGPAELEAKADILADQAKRVEAQAQALGARVADLRSRRELRRRSGQLEHDPFAPLEGSKRRAMTGTATAPHGPASTTGRDGVAPASALPSAPPASTAPAPSVYLRDVLDPGTLGELRKLEQSGTPASNIEALERAIGALNQKAQHLDAQSKALRQSAHTGH